MRLLKKEREDEEDAAWREQGAVVESLVLSSSFPFVHLRKPSLSLLSPSPSLLLEQVISEESPSEETLRTAIERLDALQKPLLVENEAEGKGKAGSLLPSPFFPTLPQLCSA